MFVLTECGQDTHEFLNSLCISPSFPTIPSLYASLVAGNKMICELLYLYMWVFSLHRLSVSSLFVWRRRCCSSYSDTLGWPLWWIALVEWCPPLRTCPQTKQANTTSGFNMFILCASAAAASALPVCPQQGLELTSNLAAFRVLSNAVSSLFKCVVLQAKKGTDLKYAVCVFRLVSLELVVQLKNSNMREMTTERRPELTRCGCATNDFHWDHNYIKSNEGWKVHRSWSEKNESPLTSNW